MIVKLIEENLISWICSFIQFLIVGMYSLFIINNSEYALMNSFSSGLFMAIIYCYAGHYRTKHELKELQDKIEYLELRIENR